MTAHQLKNIPFSQPLALADLVEYQEGQVVSRTLLQSKATGITLFAFDANEEISAHTSKGDAMVYILHGSASVTIGEAHHNLEAGQTIVMPAGIPHAVQAISKFKMLLVVVFPG
ncbi:MAG: cupin domain-containing protein [Proteobacteria bacterium]|nr:cupin domain-containing protein [Pseudomonadota bacterium]